MHRRAGPLLLLAILSVLALGAAATAVVQSPRAADLTIHNAAGELVAASEFQVTIVTQSTAPGSQKSPPVTETALYRSPAHVTVSLSSAGKRGANQVLTPAQAAAFLSSITTVTARNGWTSSGEHFANHEPVTSLVPAKDTSLVSGAVNLDAIVRGGYLVQLVENIDVTFLGNHQQSRVTLDVSEVDGHPV